MNLLRVPWLNADPTKDWEEDFHLENGNYSNKCCICGCIFLGYKRRVVCKRCELSDEPT